MDYIRDKYERGNSTNNYHSGSSFLFFKKIKGVKSKKYKVQYKALIRQPNVKILF